MTGYPFATVLVCLFFGSLADAAPREVAGRTLTEWQGEIASEDDTRRLRAARTIGIFGESAIPVLREMLGHEDVVVRYWAASHLGDIGKQDSEAEQALCALAAHESFPLQLAVAYALLQLEVDGEWHRPLFEGIRSDQRGTVCTAGDFLARIGPKAKALLPVVEARYRELKEQGDYHARGALENAVRGIRGDGVLEAHERPLNGGALREPNWGELSTGPAPRLKAEARKRPNILWISCEDISPNLGCYGDEYASTPNLDRLAAQGVRYTHAFTPAGVCAVTRTGIISGMYPISYGGQHMRSTVPFPEGVKHFPEYLRQAGYFCTNKSKTDYQSKPDLDKVWDRQGNDHSDWRERAVGQPFFSVVNLTCSHESQIRHGEETHALVLEKLGSEQRHDPELAAETLPPIYPSTPEARKDWAWYHDNISLMDRQVGELLERLDEDGLTENTVVIFWSDHGRGLPRGKRWIYDSGVHIPLIVRWPGVMEAGDTSDELVSTQDLPPTMLSLAAVEPKTYMHGRVFLGEQKETAPAMLFFHRDRMDEALETMRGARDHRFKYIRNFAPLRPYAQHIDYMDQMPTLVDLRRLNAAGELDEVQGLFFRKSKPTEELYDVVVDPHETVNLAGEPEYRETLVKMRSALEDWQECMGDLGMVPEPIMMERLAK